MVLIGYYSVNEQRKRHLCTYDMIELNEADYKHTQRKKVCKHSIRTSDDVKKYE